MMDGKDDALELDKRCEHGGDKNIDTSQKPKCSAKYIFFLVKKMSKEAYRRLRNNKLASFFFAAVICSTILNFHFFKILEKKPCDITLCNQRKEDVSAEIISFLNSVDNLNLTLQKLQENMQSFAEKMKNTETDIKLLQNNSYSLRKSFEEEHKDVKKKQDNFYYALVLFLLITAMIVVYIIWKFYILTRKTEEKTGRELKGLTFESDIPERKITTRELSDVPSVLYFSDKAEESRIKSLTKSFLGNRKFSLLLIAKEEDFLEINSKLVFLFVDFNDRNIILEGPHETSQWKRRIVQTTENEGGKAVVIYQYHQDSRELQDGCLYSEKLTSIQWHPVLRRLSKKGRVLSICNEFTKWQCSHLERLCQNILSECA